MIDLLMPTIAQGLLWAIMALGVYITYRVLDLSLIHISEPTRLGMISYAVFCLKKKKKIKEKKKKK